MSAPLLPTVNACLNAGSAVLLAAGWRFVRKGRIRAHRWSMTGAFVLSTLFLALYLGYHSQAGLVRFQGTGVVRIVYFSILIPHTILAIANLPLILRTFYLALNGRYVEHRKIARWTLPIWGYVSATGVAVYLMLFHL